MQKIRVTKSLETGNWVEPKSLVNKLVDKL